MRKPITEVGRTTRAWGFRRYGGPDVLQEIPVPIPSAGPGQVLIEVAATSVNPADTYFRAGRFRLLIRLKLPFVPGLDVAGVVAATGSGSGRFSVGDPVFAALTGKTAGGYARYVAVDESAVARAPSSLSLQEAAAVPLVALTALQGLRDVGGMGAGDRVLVFGAAGGVGTAAVQVAARLGAEVTAATTPDQLGFVRGLGAHEVVNRDRWRESLGGGRFDLVFDASGKLSARALRPLVRREGTAVTVNPGTGNPLIAALSRLLPGAAVRGFLVRPSGGDLVLLRGWIEDGSFRPVIQETLPIQEVARAHRVSEGGGVRGKLVLTIPSTPPATPRGA